MQKFLVGDIVAIRNDCLVSSRLITGTVVSELQGMYYVVSDDGHARYIHPTNLMRMANGIKLSTLSTDLSTNSEKA